MSFKRRTLNELRQTKDSHYVSPYTTSSEDNLSVVEAYLTYMRTEKRMAQASIKNFLGYLEANDMRIVKA